MLDTFIVDQNVITSTVGAYNETLFHYNAQNKEDVSD